MRFVPIFFCLCFLQAGAQQKQWLFTLDQTSSLVSRQPDSAYIIIKELMVNAREKNDYLVEAICLQQLGQVFYNYGNYSQSVDYFLQAEKMLRAHNEPGRLAENLNLLGRVYYFNKQVSLARKQFDEALQLNLSQQNIKGLAFTYGNIGHLYEKKLKYDSARFYQQKALQHYRQVDDSIGMAKIYENMGSIFEDLQQFDSARICFEQALLLNQLHKNEIAQIEILNNLGDVNRKTGRHVEGLNYTRQALVLAERTASQYHLASAYRDMARSHEILKNYDSAYHYNELSRELIEVIYSSSNNQQITLLETIYEVEKKNNEIARLASEKRINTILTIGVSLVIILLIILGLVTISRQRLKIKTEKAVNEQNKHELRNQYLEEERLKSTLEVRSKELSAHTLHLIQKNQLLEELRGKLNEIVNDDKRDQKKQLKQLIQKISINFTYDNYWDDFRAIFDQVHHTFFANLKQFSDNLTPAELKLVALLRMSLSSLDIATLLGISQDSLRVARYRLRKKLGLAEGESLTAFIQRL
jgi:tetratricopeptide (TPR) repeat protein